MARQCTCVRCKAENFVRSIYPNMDDKKILSVATEIVKRLCLEVKHHREVA